jgi:glycosyltransferase involved in cell wall biosynthesis
MPSHLKHVLIAADFARITGGQSKVAIDTALLLAEAGVEVSYFAAVGPVGPQLEQAGIEVICLDASDILSNSSRWSAAVSGIWNSTAAKELAAVAAGLDPRSTVLHCHGYSKALSPAIGPVLREGPLRAVYTMHEYFLACPNGGFYDYQRNEICRRRALGPACLTTNCDARSATHKAWRAVRQLVTWKVGGIPAGLSDIIYISETQLRVMKPYLSAESRLHYVPNPLPALNERPVDVAQNDIFLSVGRLSPEKGGVLFAKAARMAGVRAVFVGEGEERDAIRKANPDAELVGWQTPAEVRDWLGRARALVFPSVWYETHGLAALEALARGVPVVCGSWNAAAEAIVDGVTGVLFDRPQPEDLAAAIKRVATLGSVTLEPRPPAMVSVDEHRRRLLAVYEEILARP